MKIYLTIGQDELEGYTTLSPLRGYNIREIDSEIVALAEAQEILATDIVDFIPVKVLPNVLSNYVSKLRKGGKILIGGTDIQMLSVLAARREIDVHTLNETIYGVDSAVYAKSGMVSINDVSALLEQLGLRLTSKKLNGIKYLVEAVRG